MITYSHRIRELRKKKRWTVMRLCVESGALLSVVRRIESGKLMDPPIGQLKKIAAALGVGIDALEKEL